MYTTKYDSGGVIKNEILKLENKLIGLGNSTLSDITEPKDLEDINCMGPKVFSLRLALILPECAMKSCKGEKQLIFLQAVMSMKQKSGHHWKGSCSK